MYSDFEKKLQNEIRKRAFARRDRLRHEKHGRQCIQHTLDALHQVTALPRSELEAIVDEVKFSLEVSREEFFSIKNQILVTLGMSVPVLISVWLLFMI
jgi:hypothetical protein